MKRALVDRYYIVRTPIASAATFLDSEGLLTLTGSDSHNDDEVWQMNATGSLSYGSTVLRLNLLSRIIYRRKFS